mgnify:FL=1
MITDLNEILVEWSYRTSDGKPDVKNNAKLLTLESVLRDFGWSREARAELLNTLMEAPENKPLSKQDKEKVKKMGLVWKGKGYGKENEKGISFKNVDGKLVKIDKDGDDEKGGEKLDEPSEFDRDVDSNKGVSPDFKRSVGDDGEEKDDESKGIIAGNPKEGDNQVKNDMFKYGYKKFEKATGTKPAPGGAGSAFNEIVSGEGVHLLKKNPNISDEELAKKMYELTEDTALGKEQAQTPGTGKVPEGIKNKKLWSKCVVSARSAKKKYERTQKRIENLQKQNKFSKPKKTSTFYGAKSSIDAQIKMVENSNRVLLPNGQEVTQEDAVAFIKAGGGGMNPSDTATFVEDNDNNLLIQFHSDKTTTNDIQDNSTLSQEGENYKKSIDNLKISESKKKTSKEIVDSYSSKISEIEENYQREAVPVAKNMLKLPIEKQMEVLDENPQTVQNNINKSLFGANKKPPINSKFSNYIETGKDSEELTLKDKYEVVLKYVADGNKLTDELTKVINKVGLAYEEKYPDTKGVNVKRNLSQQREKVVNMQRERINKLNEVQSGLGTRMEAEEATRAFHLTMMDYPPKKYEEGNPNSMIGSALDVNMGGNIVNGKVLRDCIGVQNSKDFTENFELKETDDLTYDKETGTVVTGKKVFTYIVDKEGNKTEIGYKSYRSKNGAAGKTDNTMTYSSGMQKCFKTGEKP